MENPSEPNFYAEELQSFGLTPTDEFATLRMEGYSVEFQTTFSRTWGFIKPHLGQLIGYTVFCIFAYFTLTFIIPQLAKYMGELGYLVGAIINMTFISAFLAGFYCYLEKIYRKEKNSFRTFFDGFQHIAQLALYQILVMVVLLTLFLGVFFVAQQMGINKTVDLLDSNTYEKFTIFYYIIYIFPSLLVFSLYLFTPILIVVTRINFWSAMEISRKLVMANFIGIFGFVMAFVLLNVLGLLFFGIGILITFPITFAATFILYVKLIEKNGRSTDFSGDFYTDENAPLDAF